MTPLTLKLLLTFLVGGSWVILSTVVAERAGTKVGGVIAGLPSSSLVAFFFIGWTQSPETASQATTLGPLSMGVVALFNVVYALLYPRGFGLALVGSLGTWLLLSLGLLALNIHNYGLSILGLLFLALVAYYVLEHRLDIPSQGQQKVHYTPGQLALRGLFGGTIIACAVLVAKLGGPIVGGVMATFPNVMLSTLILNHVNHGRAFASAVLKSMTVSGMTNVTLYLTAVRYLYPLCGLVLGTLLSFALSLLGGYLVYQFVRARMT
jgi:uncharacterized membrane protein (GlpM family)